METTERLIASPVDRDSQNDVYMSSGGTMTMVSPGGNDTVATNAYFIASSDDGSKVFIRSEESLVAGDTDSYQDIYEFSGGTLTRLSVGPNGGNGAMHAFFGGASADGTHVYFETYESLVAGDTDVNSDVYERFGGATEQISGGVSGGNGPYDATFRSASPDGNRVFFRTSESLLAADTDGAADVYSANVPGTVTVLLDSIPNDPQDFSFTALGLDDGFAIGPPNFGPTNFSLDDDSDRTLVNQKVFTGVTPGAGYSVTQAAQPGWDQTAAVCDNGSSPSAIDVNAGQNVTCSFTNQKRGQIVLVLDSVPNDAQDFNFTAGGGLSPSSVSLDDDSDGTLSNTVAFADVPVGAGYSLSQGTLPTGWTQASATCSDGSPISNISVSAGETVTCTFTNNKPGRIVVVMDADPNDAQDFNFTTGGGLTPASFTLDDDGDPTFERIQNIYNVIPGGGYSISETVPSGWVLANASCDEGSPVGNITISPGEVITCTFTNLKRGQIVVVKDAQPNDAQDFSFTAGGGLSPTSFQLDDDSNGTLSNTRTFTNIAPGSGYSVAETVPSGWDQSSATCSDGSPISNVSVAAAETVTCTFTNYKRGQVVIVQDSIPNDQQDFSLHGGGRPDADQLRAGRRQPARPLPGSITFSNLQARNGYFVSQTARAAGP